MGEKCDSHDECFNRLYGKVEAFDDKLTQGFNDIKDLLHEGAIIHAKHEFRIAALEQKVANAKVNWTQFFIDLLKDLVRFGFFAGGAAAWWALQNGYKG